MDFQRLFDVGPRTTAILVLAWVGILLPTATVRAEEPRAFTLDENDPEGSVPSDEVARRMPLEMGYFVMDLAAKAEEAEEAGQYARAAKFYRAMAKAVPDRATGYAKACAMHAAAREWPEAVDFCRTTLGIQGLTIDDLIRFVGVMIQKDSPITSEERSEIDGVLARLETEVGEKKGGKELVLDLRCQLAVRLEDLDALEACSNALLTIAPKSPKTFVYASTLAYARNDLDAAEDVLARAKEAGLPADAVGAMGSVLEAKRASAPSWSANPFLVLVGLLAVVLAIGVVVRARSSRGRAARVA